MLGWKTVFINFVTVVLAASFAQATLTAADYETVTKRLRSEFASDFARATNGRPFQIQYNFNNETSAIANYLPQALVVGGGYKGIESMNPDAFTLLLCQEIGQYLGGAPFVKGRSVKGQADYFATSKCLPRIWKSENNMMVVNRWVYSKEFARKCSQSFSQPNRVALCIRSAIASQVLALILNDLTPNKEENPKPHFRTPDPSIDQSGLYKADYPSNQCRLDTMLAGSYCNINPYISINMFMSSATGCPKGNGERPRCWYQPDVGP